MACWSHSATITPASEKSVLAFKPHQVGEGLKWFASAFCKRYSEDKAGLSHTARASPNWPAASRREELHRYLLFITYGHIHKILSSLSIDIVLKSLKQKRD